MSQKFLGQTVKNLQENGADHTAREISGQPALWIRTWEKVSRERDDLKNFLDRVLNIDQLEVVLTGAGTSAYIGETAEPIMRGCWSPPVRALPTTTLVTHFEHYIDPQKPLLLVSFARSGNSPESLRTVQLAEELCQKEVFHLLITCNPEGELAQTPSSGNSYTFFLPPEAEDQSLAMTGSFTAMLLAILLIAQVEEVQSFEKEVQQLSESGQLVIDQELDKIQDIAQLDFKRAVFLGSGPRLGTARESHLKVQELTDGNVICKYDSFLGFRHGPKAVIDEQTLLVYLFSQDPGVLPYEKDLVKSVNEKGLGLASLGVGQKETKEIGTDFNIALGAGGTSDSSLWPVVSVLPAQILGFFLALKYGLKPDSPSASGAISRVVEGVTIY
ncbi:SIS domain-containing protein [Aliifodinibius sp. S!AR15-10]|uniref:SIS domain-containing protein n=1 Tax=Aliifodinibius sp. S!AR15-10 TaxID=2950437 RepID=UPI00285B4790|nr:SIS domain-containing protein [Aliifodinibius sp. S!AR15-10]MDR8392131.1 SIS domain-containing protein [Aliifodinibius sp. S!AR15-10]